MNTRLPKIDPTAFRGVVIAVLAGVVLALTGAFGTGSAPLWLRLIYWMPMMLAGGVWAHLCSLMLDRFIALDERPWLTVFLLTITATGPIAVMVWGLTGWILAGEPYPLRALPYLIWPVLIVTATLSAINVFMARARPVQTHAAALNAPAARFPDRLPLKLKGAEIRAVQAEDHYLRVHTDRGSDLILMRLSDALDELEGLEGAQTHRSWWVARSAVRDVARGDGRATLSLEGGLSVPVSRRYARALREAGWY
ncbi:MAG: LytTR family DNA-binding domain-containing protein [Brevundimonas aurantiaca]|uniref:LytTR family DNA-binding domain-containing protein n=1 Tax=Brevundimonas aurantiaca TaxID=74316 RepID=UPI004033915B